MTERRKRPHAAAGARLLSAGVSASLMVAMVASLVRAEHRPAASAASAAVAAPVAVAQPAATGRTPLASPPPAPVVVVPAVIHTRSHAS